MKASLAAHNDGAGDMGAFASFFMGGFECSTHRLPCGRRLDIIAATRHDVFCDPDYARLREQGLRVAREGLRWHLIESVPNQYDFSSALPMVRAARRHYIQILWDLCHYGWPDDIDIFAPEFVRRFSVMAGEFARWVSGEMEGPYYFTPINEISFFSWAGADEPHLNPYCRGRGFELKCQLVRAAIAAMESIWNRLPEARFLHLDPLIHIVPKLNRPGEWDEAHGYRMAQFQAFDMLCGRLCPELGGNDKFLGVMGLNFYPNNEWVYKGPALRRSDPRYLPLRELLREVYQRYSRPLFIGETGTEGRRRARWFRYVCQEVRAAIDDGIPVLGICLYPIVNHPGWVDERHCPNGLWDYPNDHGRRAIYKPLERELQRERIIFGDVSGNELESDHPLSAHQDWAWQL